MPAVSPDATDEQPAFDPTSTDDLPAAPRRPGRSPVARRLPGSRAPPPKRRSKLVPLLFLVVLGVGGGVAWKKLNPPPPAPKVDPHASAVEAAKVAFQEGKNLVRKGQWKAAAAKFDEAAALAPEIEGLAAYLEAGKTEVPLAQHLDDAAAALDKNQLAKASRELAAVPEATQQLTRRNELQQRLVKVADERLKQARALANDRSKMRELKALAEDVLAARPNDRDALNFLDTANRALGWRPPVEKPPDPGDPAVEVISLWAGGDGNGAYAKAELCETKSPRCGKLKEQIARVQPLFKRLESLEEGELLDAVRLDKAIGGGQQSATGKQAGIRLGAVLTPKASSASARKQWGAAMAVSRKILEGDPGNPAAKGIISDGRAAAEELYKRCYVQRQTDPTEAIPLCREVTEMLPEGDELRGKAERILKGAQPD